MQIRELQLEGTKNQLRSDIEQAYTNAKAAVQSYLANKKVWSLLTNLLEPWKKDSTRACWVLTNFSKQKTVWLFQSQK